CRGFEYAQVCAGGAPLTELRGISMESALVPGLYLAGELLDVDGECGGYNLQWAWTSGRLAGRAAAEKERKNHPC
ncbi:MAG: NAD(P)/FAD-dependent oxidoreductase, partial [Lachnospiraceae bacterium]|nr:NAD(P)/FAD-dependent oxidoreductase [Lachnospiraceae bacterium]